MADIYITTQNDTWDIISLKVYGKDKYADYIIDANESYCSVVFFQAGVRLTIPELPIKVSESMPLWRKE